MRVYLFTALMLAACTSCRNPSEVVTPDKLTSINLVDRNGLSETISTKNRVAQYNKTDFLSPQPYQKVLRVYEKSPKGEVRAVITSYHPNGQVKQYLETVNNRAQGSYQEWHTNGQKKVEAFVIGGVADLNTAAEQSWLFDGTTSAWDEEGKLAAKITYSKGDLQGVSSYYHSDGTLWKELPYDKGQLHGQARFFLPDGSLFMTTEYVQGDKHGNAVRYWERTRTAFHEKYAHGLLEEGIYFDKVGKVVSQVSNGIGKRAVFGKSHLERLEEFHGGIQEGLVQQLNKEGTVVRQYYTKGGEKHGEELSYYPNSTTPRLLLTWNQGILEGFVKTWYPNGQIESQREMSQNQKNGLLTAWYQEGALMLVEEYEGDQLIKGEYYKLGEKTPISKIEKGYGLATLFSAEGVFQRKVTYLNGKPLEA